MNEIKDEFLEKPVQEEQNEAATPAVEVPVYEEETMDNFTIVSIRPGQVVNGTILRVTDSELIVNVGYKSDGIVTKDEIILDADQRLKDSFKEGDEIEVEVLKVNDGDGNVLLSQRNVARKLIWKDIEEAFKSQTIITGTGKEVVKGGLLANIKGIPAFVPASQVAVHYVENLAVYVGQKLQLKILEIDKSRGRVVASQRVVLEAVEAEKRRQVWENIQVGQRLTGEVKRLTNFGAFVDIGGVDGLIHISDLAWGHIKNPKQVVSEGQKVDVIVLSLDKENNKISLGYKQTIPHPWDNIQDKYPAGEIFQGKVVRTTTFGAFVELEPGVDGLVHISQISDKRVAKVEDVLKVGEIVNVKVLEVKSEDKKISLSIREAAAAEAPALEEPSEPALVQEEMTVSMGDFFPDHLKEQE